jgi:hypothetical protein
MRAPRAVPCFAFALSLVACGHDEAPPGAAGLDASASEPVDASLPLGDASPNAAADADTSAADGGSVEPAQACMTHYLDPKTLLSGIADPQWYVDNIPFLDVPDAQTNSHIGPVYYYRWSTLKRALRYTDATNGYVFLEFLEPPGYAATFGAISAAAGHHLYEARWLHDLRYCDDYLSYWLKGAGQSGIREYSFWVADSAWARYQVSGDAELMKSLRAPLEANYRAWSDHFDAATGLYWQVPVWDAMEDMADTYSSQNPDKDPYHGGPGFRPTINAYQYADARALANIARLTGDTSAAATWDGLAAALVTAMQTNLWSPDLQFFVHKYRDSGALFLGREEIGFVPWQFNMPMAGYERAWENTITNPASFYTKYGPRTVEKSDAYYLQPYQRGQCCHWNGPLWPYATTQTLAAMSNLLNHYSQSYVTRADYFQLLENFAQSQYKNGVPYIAEALDPDDTTGAPIWTYDSPAHSEHYNHSGFVDPVISGLIGLHPSETDVVSINPLTPAAWDHFMLENVRYHGHYLTIVWDADGSHYGAGAGFTLVQDCAVLQHRPTLGPMQATLAHGTWPPAKQPRTNNLFANAAGGAYPKATASYTFSVDDIAQINDGIILYDHSVGGSPNDANVHNRWTNYSSPNASDWVQIDLGSAAALTEMTLHLYSDGKGVVPPVGYAIETSTDGTHWTAVSNVTKTPITPAEGPNVARFDRVTARYCRVTFQVSAQCKSGSGCAGLTELEAWVAP